MSDFVKNIKKLIANNNTEKALNDLYEKFEDLNNELEDEIILLRGRWSDFKKDKNLNAKNERENEQININKAVLTLVRKINNDHADLLKTNEVQPSNNEIQTNNEKEVSSLQEIKDAITILKQSNLGHNSSEEDLKQAHDLKQKLYNEIFGDLDDKIENIDQIRTFESGIHFDKIFANVNLNKLITTEVVKIRTEKQKYEWYDRSLIVSGLTLSLITHKFDSKKVGLLIDFLTEFEEEVWQRALIGLVITLNYHQNRIYKYQHIVKRLKNLQNIPKVQLGLKVIDLILLFKLYENTLFDPKMYNNPFFKKPRNCFLPYYKTNPIIEDALENTNEKDLDLDEIEDYITKMPLLNAHKYFLAQSLKSSKLVKKKVKKNALRTFNNTLNLSHFLNPYQNLITEIHAFFTYYPESNVKNLFERQASIANTKLKDIILSEKEKLSLSARTAFFDKRYTKAIEYCDKLLKMEPSDIEVLSILGNSLLEKGIFHRAIKIYNRLITNDKGDAGLYNGQLGKIYYKKNDYNKSVKYYLQAHELKKNDFEYLLMIGTNYIELEKYDEALEFLLNAKKIKPEDGDALSNIGVALLKLNQKEEALEYSNKALNVDPNNSKFNNNHGVILRSLGRNNEALEFFNNALKKKPKDAMILYNLSITSNNLYKHKDALLFIRKALSISSKNLDYLNELSETLGTLNRFKEGLKYSKKMMKLEPKNARYINTHSRNLLGLRNYDEALIYQRKAIKIEPDSSKYLNTLGNILLFMNNLEDAELTLLKALEIRENFAVYGNLGHLELVRNNEQKAISYYKKGLETTENHDHYFHLLREDASYLEEVNVDLVQYEEIIADLEMMKDSI